MKETSSDINSRLCPVCDAVITADSINIEEGVALCGSCGLLGRLSELNFSGISMKEALENRPVGCKLSWSNEKIVITASLYSLSGFLTFVGVALFWNGITSIFLSTAAAGIYYNTIGPIPDWFPAAGIENGAPMINDLIMGKWMTLFFCLCLMPFVIVGCGFIVIAVLKLVGKTSVVIDRSESYVSLGVPFLAWKKRFNPNLVESIKIVRSKFQDKVTENNAVEIDSDKTTRFGFLLTKDQKEWFTAILKVIFLKPKQHRYDKKMPYLSWLKK